MRFFNGQRWIRTIEASCSRFTVCPLWPLGNLPMYSITILTYFITTYVIMQAYFLTIQNPHAHSQNRTILVLYRRYAANFAHMCGGWLYSSPLENKKTCCLHASMTHQLFLFSIVLNSYYFFKLKKTAYDRLPFRRRYFYYGV